MPNVDVNGTTIEFPDSLSGDELNQAVSKAASQIGNQPQSDKSNWKSYTSTIARPLLEAGGAVGGGAIGSALGPFGTAGGGVLGYGTGKAAADLLDRSLGVKPLLSNPQSALAETGQNAYEGAKNEAIGLGIGGAASMAKPIASKLFSAGTGVPEEAIAARFANPDAIKNATPIKDLQHELPQTVQELSNHISQADKNAWNTLRTSYNPQEGALPKEDVVDLIKKAKDEVKVYGGGVVGKPAHQAMSVLDGIANDIQNIGKNVGGLMEKPGATPQLLNIGGQEIQRTEAIPKNVHLPEATVKGIIQSLDSSINWEDPNAGPVNDVLEKLRSLFDNKLKTGNPDYAAAMQPVQDKIQLLNEVKKRFGVTSQAGKGFSAGTSTQNSLENLFGKNKSVTQNTMGQLDKATGSNYLQDVQNAKHTEAFQPGMRAQGSRRTLFGGTLGAGIGHFTGSPTLGGMAGAGAGFIMDTQGGPIAANIIDTIKKLQPEINLEPKVIQAIQSAIKRAIPATVIPSNNPTPVLGQGQKVLDDATIERLMTANNDDPVKAKAVAIQEGYSWPR